MKIGVIGLPQVGKKTIFRLLTSVNLKDWDPEKLKVPIHGIVPVKDLRFDRLASMYTPEKRTPANIEIILMPKVDKEYIVSGQLFEHLKDADALCHIVRAFTNDAVYHAEGSVNAQRDIDAVNTELILADLMFTEKRLERIERESKGKQGKDQAAEKELLFKFKAHLEKELPLRILALANDEKKLISGYPFLTIKPLLMVLNISESDINKAILAEDIVEKYKSQNIYVMQISAVIEDELASLDSAGEREAFLKELGINEPAINKLTRALYDALGLISFFTAGPKEVRAWTIKSGTNAHQAAGAIHSDIERGFIRAEVIKYDDLIGLGSEHKVKEAGKLLIKGKDYIVCDGDILYIRFNV